MKHIIIHRKDLGNLPAILFYKQFAIAGEDGQVHLYQVLKEGMGCTIGFIQISWPKIFNTKVLSL